MKPIYYPVVHRPQEEIEASKSRYDDFDEQNIPVIFKSVLGLETDSWSKPTSWSTSHVIFFVSFKNNHPLLVLRANTGKSKTRETYFKVEQLVTDRVAAAGVPVNKIIYVDVSRKIFPFDFQIQEKLQGQDIEDHFKGTQDEYDMLSFSIGTYIAKMSTVTFDGFGRFDEKQALVNRLSGTEKSMYDYIITCLMDDIAYLADSQFISLKTSASLQTLFEDYKPVMHVDKGSIVQHDLADHNMFFKDGHISGIYDWEACVSSDPVLDLASAPTWKTHFPREQKLIEGFTSIRSLPDHFKEKMEIYRLRTMIWKTVFALRSGFMNDVRKKRFTDLLEYFKI